MDGSAGATSIITCGNEYLVPGSLSQSQKSREDTVLEPVLRSHSFRPQLTLDACRMSRKPSCIHLFSEISHRASKLSLGCCNSDPCRDPSQELHWDGTTGLLGPPILVQSLPVSGSAYRVRWFACPAPAAHSRLYTRPPLSAGRPCVTR